MKECVCLRERERDWIACKIFLKTPPLQVFFMHSEVPKYCFENDAMRPAKTVCVSMYLCLYMCVCVLFVCFREREREIVRLWRKK